jgi:hypothetical protein
MPFPLPGGSFEMSDEPAWLRRLTENYLVCRSPVAMRCSPLTNHFRIAKTSCIRIPGHISTTCFFPREHRLFSRIPTSFSADDAQVRIHLQLQPRFSLSSGKALLRSLWKQRREPLNPEEAPEGARPVCPDCRHWSATPNGTLSWA